METVTLPRIFYDINCIRYSTITTFIEALVKPLLHSRTSSFVKSQSVKVPPGTLCEGERLTMSGKQVEVCLLFRALHQHHLAQIISRISPEDWASGKCFLGKAAPQG
jgi:hypothetical protein